MTASEPSRDAPGDRTAPGATSERSVLDQALDLVVYLPAGLLATAVDDMPELAARGRSRVDQELRNAGVVGRFAVDFALRQMRAQLSSLAVPRPQEAAPAVESPKARSGRTGSAGGPGRAAGPAPRVPAGAGASSLPPVEASLRPDLAVDRAIPDYDILSASQVVRRLDGLTPAELSAVVRHEQTCRARRTILQRAAQLLDASGGTPGPESGDPSRPLTA